MKPTDVISPKRRWQTITILRDTGNAGESLALGNWDGSPALGMRWNGDNNSDIGNPQSRGQATWFIVPEIYWRGLLSTITDSEKMVLAEAVLKNVLAGQKRAAIWGRKPRDK